MFRKVAKFVTGNLPATGIDRLAGVRVSARADQIGDAKILT
jgi:hypothetical protein